MDIVKKNLLSIICGVVALLAIGAYFVFVGGKQAELQQAEGARIKVYQDLDGLRTKTRNIPVIVTTDTEQRPLDQFPTRAVIDAAKGVQDRMKNEAKQTLEAAVRLNKHVLLLDGSLPGTRELDRYNFRQAYIQRLDLDKERPSEVSLQKEMGAGSPPTADVIKRMSDEMWRRDYEPNIKDYGNGQNNKAVLEQQWQVAIADLPEKLTRDAAQKSKVYVDPNAFDFYQGIANATAAPSALDIWWAQVGLWIQEDVARILSRTNSRPANWPADKNWSVSDAPIKRLLKVEQPKSFLMPGQSMVGLSAGSSPTAGPAAAPAGPPGMSDRQREMEMDRQIMMEERRQRMEEMKSMRGGPGAGGPGAVAPAPSGGSALPTAAPVNAAASQPPGPPAPTASPTGRVCNSLYDVLHFTVKIDVDASQVPAVLAEFSRDQFIYVLQSQVEPLDTTLVTADGYRYGENPVVRLSLVCEELFLRNWTIPLMPDEIRAQVGVVATATAEGATR